MQSKMHLLVCIIERYRIYKKITGREAFLRCERYGLLPFLFENSEHLLHYGKAAEDLDVMIKCRMKAEKTQKITTK